MFNPAQEMSSIAFDKILGGALNAVITAQNNSAMTTVNFIKNVGFQNDAKGNVIKPVYVDFKYPKEIAPYQPGTAESYYIDIVKGGKNFAESDLNGGAFQSDELNGAVLNFTVDTEGVINAVEIVEGGEKLEEGRKITLKSKSDDEAVLEIKKRAAKEAIPAVYQDMTLQVPLLTIVPIPFLRVASTDIELNVKINSIYNSAESSETDVKTDVHANASYRTLFFKGSVNMNASVAHQKKNSSSEEVKKEYSLNIKIHAVQDEVPAGMGRILDILEEAIVPKAANRAPEQAAHNRSTEKVAGRTA